MQFTVPTENGPPIEFESADTITSRWINEAILRGETYPILDFVDDVQVVFDVGANCGATSVHLARRYPAAEIHAFEPGSVPLGYLERNVAIYENVHLHPIGLYSSDEMLPLYHGNGDSILGSVFKRDVNLDEYETIELRAAGPWAADHGIGRIDVMKVDVEGCEAEVIRSLRPLLPTVKVLYCEYDSRATRRELRDLLAPTHEMYTGDLFLDQGEAVYLRKDLADEEDARDRLRDLAAAAGFDLDAAATAPDPEERFGRLFPSIPFIGDVNAVLDVGDGDGATSDHFAQRYPQAMVRSVDAVDSQLDNGAPVDIVKVDSERGPIEVLERLGTQMADVKACYAVHRDRADLTALDRRLQASHELYLGSVFLDRGTSLYLRRDLADLEAANARLLQVFAERVNRRKR